MIAISDFLEYKSVSNPKLSPDGKKIGFCLTEPDYDLDGYRSSLWIYERESDRLRNLNTGDAFSDFAWRDDNSIAAIKPGKNDTGLYSIDIGAGAVRELGRVNLSVEEIEPIDGDRIVIRAKAPMGGAETAEEYEILDGTPSGEGGSAPIGRNPSRLFIFDRRGNSAEPLTGDSLDLCSFKLIGEKILYVGREGDDASGTRRIYLYDLRTRETSAVLRKDRYSVAYADMMQGSVFFIGSPRGDSLSTDNPGFYRVENDEVGCWLAPDMSVRDGVGFDCMYGTYKTFKVAGDCLYFVSTDSLGSALSKLRSDGSIERLARNCGAVQGIDVRGELIAYVGLKDMNLQELFLLRDGVDRQITFFNARPLTGKYVAKAERFSFFNNGYTVNYLAQKPIDFSSDGRYPAILYIHGGPKAIYGSVFYHELQGMSGSGYFVIFGNPRGSDGQGSAYADLAGLDEKPDFGDIMKAVDAALAKYPQIDPERMGVIGTSYGGTMANWIIGHTGRFKCAVAQRSLCNLISAMGVSRDGYSAILPDSGASPWKDAEKLWSMSPLKYAREIATPLLLIHADGDREYPVSEAEQLFNALRFLGGEVRLFRIKNERQSLSRLWRPRMRIRRLEILLEWFDRYLKREAGFAK